VVSPNFSILSSDVSSRDFFIRASRRLTLSLPSPTGSCDRGTIFSPGEICDFNTFNFANSSLLVVLVKAAGRSLSPIGTGSPTTTWGKVALGGTGETGAGSNAWHVFPTAFSATPVVVASSAETDEAILVKSGSIGVGSFYVETISASQSFSWVAIA